MAMHIEPSLKQDGGLGSGRRPSTLTIREAADRLGISTQTVRRWIRSGKTAAELRPGRNGLEYRLTPDEVERARDMLDDSRRRPSNVETESELLDLGASIERLRQTIDVQNVQAQQSSQIWSTQLNELQRVREAVHQISDDIQAIREVLRQIAEQRLD